MARLKQRDVREIMQVLEDGLNFIPRLEKVKKMKMRSQIRRQDNWLTWLSDPTADMIMLKLQERLPEIIPLFPYGHLEKLKKLLHNKITQMQSKKDT